MTIMYAREKFGIAVGALIGEDKNLRKCLEKTAINNISMVVPERDLPKHLQKDCNDLLEKLTRVNGSIPDTISEMDKQEVSEVALNILDLYVKILKEKEPS